MSDKLELSLIADADTLAEAMTLMSAPRLGQFALALYLALDCNGEAWAKAFADGVDEARRMILEVGE